MHVQYTACIVYHYVYVRSYIEVPWHLLDNAWCNACIQCRHMISAKGFALIRIKIQRDTREYRCLLVSMDAEAARAGTDRYTDRHTRQLP